MPAGAALHCRQSHTVTAVRLHATSHLSLFCIEISGCLVSRGELLYVACIIRHSRVSMFLGANIPFKSARMTRETSSISEDSELQMPAPALLGQLLHGDEFVQPLSGKPAHCSSLMISIWRSLDSSPATVDACKVPLTRQLKSNAGKRQAPGFTAAIGAAVHPGASVRFHIMFACRKRTSCDMLL